MKIHIALVSEQILANLIPALMERPDLMYLVCTDAKKEMGNRLAKPLKKKDIVVKLKSGAPHVGMKIIHEFALDLAGEIESGYPDAEIILNATGGTKLMALGFIEVFRGIARHILYTDTAHRRIEYLPDDQGTVPDPVPMNDVLNVPDYLAAQGFRFKSAISDSDEYVERASGRKLAAKYLGKHSGEIQDFIGKLNYLADQALGDDESLSQPVQSLDRVGKRWATVLRVLVKAGLLHWSEERPETVVFIDVESTRFLRGGWLEEYVWHTVRDEGVFDVRMSVEGAWEDTSKSHNEFDVLACHDNQLLFIECKTARIHDRNDSDMTYKVDSLSQDARGLFGKTWLVTARDPTVQLRERTKQADIKLIGPDQLPKLREIVQAWKNGESIQS